MNRYTTIGKEKTIEGRRYIQNAIYPDIPETEDDIYVITTVGDRYDTLAQQYYSDLSLWWIIATANPTANSDSLVITPGIQIRIPGSPSKIVGLYESLNKKR
jgi:hypothetical protein|tara:strand:+ start:1815 stop:2120 length:306 start_codon:yes stop_codon:yes gene_type:complete